VKIRICKSYHSETLLPLVRASWESDDLLIFCPPHLENFDWIQYLPQGEIEWIGFAATSGPTPESLKIPRANVSYVEKPVLGVFTSGTISGQPRLVLYTKKNVESSLEAIVSLFDKSRIHTIFSYAQPFHTFGLLLGYVLSFKLGCRLITPSGKYGASSHDRRLEIRDPHLLTLGTPTHFHDLIETARKRGLKLPPSYSCIVGGASVSVGLWKSIRDDLQIEQPSIGYGCTEASPGITHLPPGRVPLEDSEIGFPLSSLQTELHESEVNIAGPSLCLCVIDENGVDFAKSRSIRDRIHARPDSVWVFHGRTDLMINRGGEKFSLERIENSIFTEFGLHALAVRVPDARLGEDLGLLVKSDPLDQSHFEKLRDFLMKSQGLRIEFNQLRFAEEFPLNSSSKPDRAQTARLFQFPNLNVPIAAAALAMWLPHREPMMWIDEVSAFDEQGGEARVLLRADGYYMNSRGLRPSSVVEFIAQTFGFVSVCQGLSHSQSTQTSDSAPSGLKKAFLAAVRDVNLSVLESGPAVTAGTRLVIRVGNVKQFGPIRSFDGWICTESPSREIARANLKVFSE
jgi:predicted hotdog family 3-hydroxylacyl-ACP dehydratase